MRNLTLPVPSDRALRALKYVVGIAVGIAVVALILAFAQLSQRIDSADDDRAALQRTNDAQDATLTAQDRALDEANRRLLDAGKQPVATPPAPVTVIGDQGETGATGPRGFTGPAPSATQVRNAVLSYCASGRCDGTGPTAAQVERAVGIFCANGKCRGATGKDGADGQDGDDGESIRGADGPRGETGARGPGPTDAQIGSAVQTFCADGRCRGPAGAQGPAGQDAPDPVDDPDPNDPEIQDPEIQDPEIDDPDPASPFTFTFVFTVPSDIPNRPGTTYTVTCDSGTGACTVS